MIQSIEDKSKRELVEIVNIQQAEYQKLLAENEQLKAEGNTLRLLAMRMVDRWWPFFHGNIASETAKNLLKEATDAINRDVRLLELHNLEQQAKGVEDAVKKAFTHRPFRPLKSEIDSQFWKAAYKKGYEDACAEIEHESTKLRQQAKEQGE